jgi:hypothetical protein
MSCGSSDKSHMQLPDLYLSLVLRSSSASETCRRLERRTASRADEEVSFSSASAAAEVGGGALGDTLASLAHVTSQALGEERSVEIERWRRRSRT